MKKNILCSILMVLSFSLPAMSEQGYIQITPERFRPVTYRVYDKFKKGDGIYILNKDRQWIDIDPKKIILELPGRLGSNQDTDKSKETKFQLAETATRSQESSNGQGVN